MGAMPVRHHRANLAVDMAFVPVYLASLGAYGLYRSRDRRIGPSGLHDVVDVVHALLVGGICSLALDTIVLRISGRIAVLPEEVLVLSSLGALAVPLGRSVVASFSSHRMGPQSRVAIVGSGRVADALIARLARYPNVTVVAQFGAEPSDGSSAGEPLSHLRNLCQAGEIDRVVVAFSRTPTAETLDALREVVGQVSVSIVPRFFELVSWRSRVDELYGLAVVDVAPSQRWLARFLKRAFDITGSLILLVLGSPAFVAIATVIKLTSCGPVLFQQPRTGRAGKPFTMYKFRTMVDHAEDQRGSLAANNDIDGPLFKLHRDPRVTGIGAFLRRTSLDELPQIINVLKGDMSFVGPRPFICPESDQIGGWAAKRFDVRPGMTGLWQVSGRSELTFEDLRRLDYLYVTSWSLWWDLRILAQTPRTVFRQLGAY